MVGARANCKKPSKTKQTKNKMCFRNPLVSALVLTLGFAPRLGLDPGLGPGPGAGLGPGLVLAVAPVLVLLGWRGVGGFVVAVRL